MTDTKHAGTPRCPKCGSTDVSLGIVKSLNRIRILCGGCPRAEFVTEVADFKKFFPLRETNGHRGDKLTDLTNDEMYKKFQDSLHAGFACLTDAIVAFAFQIQRETREELAGENELLRKVRNLWRNGRDIHC